MYYLHVLWKMTEVTVLYFVFGSHWQYQVCYSGENCTKADILFCGRTMECENAFLCIIISMSTFLTSRIQCSHGSGTEQQHPADNSSYFQVYQYDENDAAIPVVMVMSNGHLVFA